MNTQWKYLKLTAFFLLVALTSQSCSSSFEEGGPFRIVGEMYNLDTEEANDNAFFTIVDKSENPEPFRNVFSEEIDGRMRISNGGRFSMSYEERESMDDLYYYYGDSLSVSLEQPLIIGAGETLNLGVLFIHPATAIKFVVDDSNYIEGLAIEFETVGANKFQANSSTPSATGGNLQGYVYPNQSNTITTIQKDYDGIEIREIYEIDVDEVAEGMEIYLLK